LEPVELLNNSKRKTPSIYWKDKKNYTIII